MSQLLPELSKEQHYTWLNKHCDFRTNHKYPTWVMNSKRGSRIAGDCHLGLTAYPEKVRPGHWRPVMKIQFSAPKLFWGNNLDELEDHHANPLADKLKLNLAELGLNPVRESLLRAPVANLHYSKNILLTNDMTTAEVIGHIGKIQASGRFNKQSNRYKRGGVGINIFNQSFSFSMYDKVAEVMIDSPELLTGLAEVPQVLRLEARLENKSKLNNTFNKLDLGSSPTFQEVFDSEKSRQVVTHYWQELVAPQAALVTETNISANTIIRQIMRSKPDAKVHTVLKLTALALTGRAPGGLSELRTIVLHHAKKNTWYRLHRQIKEVSQVLETEEGVWWEQIETQLAEYESLSLIEN